MVTPVAGGEDVPIRLVIRVWVCMFARGANRFFHLFVAFMFSFSSDRALSHCCWSTLSAVG